MPPEPLYRYTHTLADLLDQSDIDALLTSATTPADEGEIAQQSLIFSKKNRDPETTEIKIYDFKRPERVSKDQMRALQTLHEAFARNFGASLSGFLRTIVEVKVATCEQMTYAEFTSGLPNPQASISSPPMASKAKCASKSARSSSTQSSTASWAAAVKNSSSPSVP
jgi:flagellar motor switch protein FliM